MSIKQQLSNKSSTDKKSKLTSEQIASRMKELQYEYNNLIYEKSYLQYIIASSHRTSKQVKLDNFDGSIKSIANNNTDNDDTIMDNEIQRLTLERNYLLKEVSGYKEENEDLYETLKDITIDKEKLNSDINKLQTELESCQNIIDDLVLDRDKMKAETATKDTLLECYKNLFDKDKMFRFRIPHSELVKMKNT